MITNSGWHEITVHLSDENGEIYHEGAVIHTSDCEVESDDCELSRLLEEQEWLPILELADGYYRARAVGDRLEIETVTPTVIDLASSP